MLTPDPRWWSLHSHSKFSVNDALPTVEAMVEKADEFGYRAMGLTDHGSPSGSIALYKACRRFGIEPLPGIELYVVPDTEYASRSDNMHLTIAAYSEAGYRNLMHLSTLSNRRFWYKPRIDFADFAAMAQDGATKGLVVATGCHFGVLPQVLMKQGPAAAAQVAKALAGWFPRVYIELQNHGIGQDHKDETEFTDDEVVEGLWQVAQETGIPVLIARDSHYVNESDRPIHEALKRMVSFSDDVDDAVFPGGGYHMCDSTDLPQYFEPHVLEAGLAGLDDLANVAYVRLPELEKFTLKVPDVSFGIDPQLELEEKVMAAFALSPYAGSKPHLAQIRDEFDVIRAGEMAPYLLLVALVAEFMLERKISFHTRGSASGSLVLMLMKVTQIDPVRFGLRFDAFLSLNRMKPPDVDFDVEHTRRDEVIGFLNSRWSVRGVGSLRKYSLDDEDEDEGKGSLRVRFYSALRKRGLKIMDWRDVPLEDRHLLKTISDMGLISGYGTHAAGYIVAPDEETVAQLPMAYIASSKKMVTAYGKKDVEILGFTKLDLLGLRTRTAIRITEELTGLDFETIPDNDKETMAMIGEGRVSGVFQLDGAAMRRGVETMRPKRLEDIIAAQALFRPATLNSGATADYRARRKGSEPIPKRHHDIMSITAETYGVLLYQEQVMDVMETLGMSQAELEQMLDAVKASNEYSAGAAVVIADKLPLIKELATNRGWDQDDLDWLVDAIGAYADYSFKKAHAAAYGVVSYRTAFMKRHYPPQFWTGMLIAYTDASKKKGRPHPTVTYARSARMDGVKIFPTNVNLSEETFMYEPDFGGIRKGLVQVTGVGPVAARELIAKRPFTSLKDLGEKVLPRRVTGAKNLPLGMEPYLAGGNITALYEAGALQGLV